MVISNNKKSRNFVLFERRLQWNFININSALYSLPSLFQNDKDHIYSIKIWKNYVFNFCFHNVKLTKQKNKCKQKFKKKFTNLKKYSNILLILFLKIESVYFNLK